MSDRHNKKSLPKPNHYFKWERRKLGEKRTLFRRRSCPPNDLVNTCCQGKTDNADDNPTPEKTNTVSPKRQKYCGKSKRKNFHPCVAESRGIEHPLEQPVFNTPNRKTRKYGSGYIEKSLFREFP